MKSLVVGAGGFVGGYLLGELKRHGGEICATKLPEENVSADGVSVYDLDVCDAEAVSCLIKKLCPDRIYHLAAVSSAALSWKKPQLTMQINVVGTINLLEAVRAADNRPRVLLVGSAEEYGCVRPEEIPIKENVRPAPANIYAVSKLTQNLLGGLYAKAYGADIISVRAFNHIGPMQSDAFVASSFCRQVAEAEKKTDRVIHVGNLSAVRDFTDVRDVVRAYALIMEKGVSGKTYNVGGGAVLPIAELLDKIIALSETDVRVEVDEDKLRPIDAPKFCADITELKKDTGWEPAYTLDKTLSDMLDYWRVKYV